MLFLPCSCFTWTLTCKLTSSVYPISKGPYNDHTHVRWHFAEIILNCEILDPLFLFAKLHWKKKKIQFYRDWVYTAGLKLEYTGYIRHLKKNSIFHWDLNPGLRRKTKKNKNIKRSLHSSSHLVRNTTGPAIPPTLIDTSNDAGSTESTFSLTKPDFGSPVINTIHEIKIKDKNLTKVKLVYCFNYILCLWFIAVFF